MVRIAVIGAGVVGSLIAREACRYEAEVHLFERCADVGWGVTKANSAIVHSGFHDAKGTVRSRFCPAGNEAYATLCAELEVPFIRCGAYVLARTPENESMLHTLLEQGQANGVPGLCLHDAEQVHKQEPNVHPDVRMGLWSPTVGITEPWGLTIAAVENAQSNGLILHLSEEITGIDIHASRVTHLHSSRGGYDIDVVVNAAGLFAEQISAMAGVAFPALHPRRGEYVLLDKHLQGTIRSVLFPTPTRKSKGILVLPTVDGGILLGPNAQDLSPSAREDVETTCGGLTEVIDGARKLVPGLDLVQRIKTFAGLRPETPNHDFILGPTEVSGFFQAAGMRSPGLTAAPSIAPWLIGEIARELNLERREAFVANRPAIPKPSELEENELDELIKLDPRFGRVVCYCNEVTEGEVVEAIRRGGHTVDGVKFRTRAGFGRCQGGSCATRIQELIASELRCPRQQVVQNESSSWLVSGEVRP